MNIKAFNRSIDKFLYFLSGSSFLMLVMQIAGGQIFMAIISMIMSLASAALSEWQPKGWQ